MFLLFQAGYHFIILPISFRLEVKVTLPGAIKKIINYSKCQKGNNNKSHKVLYGTFSNEKSQSKITPQKPQQVQFLSRLKSTAPAATQVSWRSPGK